MKETDDLLMKADLLTLFGLLSKLADYSQGKEDKELIRILLSLDEFVEIHKTPLIQILITFSPRVAHKPKSNLSNN